MVLPDAEGVSIGDERDLCAIAPLEPALGLRVGSAAPGSRIEIVCSMSVPEGC